MLSVSRDDGLEGLAILSNKALGRGLVMRTRGGACQLSHPLSCLGGFVNPLCLTNVSQPCLVSGLE